MKLRLLFIIGTLLISLIGPEVTSALIFCVGGGGLSITSVPSSIDFGDIEVSTSDAELPITFTNPVYFEDMRGILVSKTLPRFSVHLTITDLVDSSGDIIDLTNISVATDENDTIEIEDCSPKTVLNPLLTDLTPFTDSDDDGISDSMVLLTGRDPMTSSLASIIGEKRYAKIEKLLKGKWKVNWLKFLNSYVGKYSFTPEMELTIPAYTPSGDYETVMTFTIV